MNVPDDYGSYTSRCDLCGDKTHPAELCGCDKYRCFHCEEIFNSETGGVEIDGHHVCPDCVDKND